jgi:SAC3/GANP family
MRTNQVSILECFVDQYGGQQQSKTKTLDPCRAVSKYRRSAAGLSANAQYPPRSVAALRVTVEYLVRHVLCGHVLPYDKGDDCDCDCDDCDSTATATATATAVTRPLQQYRFCCGSPFLKIACEPSKWI